MPRGPKRKKLWLGDGLSNREYISLFYIVKWSCQVMFAVMYRLRTYIYKSMWGW